LYFFKNVIVRHESELRSKNIGSYRVGRKQELNSILLEYKGLKVFPTRSPPNNPFLIERVSFFLGALLFHQRFPDMALNQCKSAIRIFENSLNIWNSNERVHYKRKCLKKHIWVSRTGTIVMGRVLNGYHFPGDKWIRTMCLKRILPLPLLLPKIIHIGILIKFYAPLRHGKINNFTPYKMPDIREVFIFL